MNREVGEAIRTLIFIALLLASVTISVSLARLRVRNFGHRLASSIVVLSDRAVKHKVNITLELPSGNYSLTFFGNGSALFSMGGYNVVLNGFPTELRGEIHGGKSLLITSEGRLLQDG
jgi:archaellum component FlaF (FlaF/FlaG flagellin family)